VTLADEVSRAPRFDAAYLDNPRPAYPAVSRRGGEQGRVLLRVLVDAAGAPTQVSLQTSSGHERLDRAAQSAVARWRFVPARRGAEPVAAWVTVPIEFSL
jgi:protein TonB